MSLNSTQLSNAQAITDYGTKNGFTDLQVELAVKVAFIESSLGLNMTNPQPGVTASGLFGYNNVGWTNHAGLGSKDSTDNQISAFFSDITTYTARYANPVVQGSGLSVDEYIYVKHHDGSNATDFVNSVGLSIFRSSDFHPDVTQYNNPTGGFGFGFDLYDPVYLGSHAAWFTDGQYNPTGTVTIGPLEVQPGTDQD
ncbi:MULTISPECIES: hypothetical protein [Pseudomonas syringae group]|uniref:hypothetical protein n=1 Tax=Pseudomonas syringae group TaxID=136849 RepID=UPI000A906A85|nr:MULTISPECIES: hypothetical protein [Pseudomonas syringae group]MEE3917284.1 hypothetical protein [Pseudomonas viridiflava]MEE3976020.1 hypothetical protein [Pseudomonas viridiflava]MEE4021078.1 hypothetical protein [Pseudomonas viridiflava]MEE4048932.1 hypothetical protein [Pseudomonas viridiflava]